MATKDPGFDLTPYKTATKRPGWANAFIAAAVLALIGIVATLFGTGAWVPMAGGIAFAAAVVAALIGLIVYLTTRR